MSDLSNVIAEAEAAFRAADGATKPSGLASSPNYDARLITWYSLYHTGKAPKTISTGRGHTYNVTHLGKRYTGVYISDYADHRAGVQRCGDWHATVPMFVGGSWI
jgi:hypothetical protein